MWKLLPFVLLSVGQAPEITEPHGTYGALGAVRPPSGVLPGDIAYFTFTVKNLKFDDEGKARYTVAIEVRDADGKLVFEQKPFAGVAQNAFGGDSVPVSVHMEVPLDAKPGRVNWKCTVKDLTTNASVEAKGQGQVLPRAFGIVRVGTFADPDAMAPVPPVGVVGSTLYLDFSVCGFGRDAKTKKPDVNVEIRILDDKGQPTLKKAISARLHDQVAPDAQRVPIQYALSMNRPGRFTVEVSARCAVSGTDARVSLPVRVLPRE